VLKGLARFLEGAVPRGVDLEAVGRAVAAATTPGERSRALIGAPRARRPPGFCTGCPERPVFAAMKLVQKELGEVHVAADIGCHSFATLPPFNMGNSILGYGLGLSSAAAVAPMFGDRRTITVMGDGGFWHNGLSTGVQAALQNRTDGVLVVLDNGYTSATGQQYIPSSTAAEASSRPRITIEAALRAMGVTWVRSQGTYVVKDMVKTLREALTTKEKGLKVIIAQQECQLARQRRIKPQIAKALKAGERVVRTRYGVDAATCTGDHSCIRLSGCPSLTVKENPDPLRRDPVRACEQRLRRLRPVRRGGGCRPALPVLLPRRHRRQPDAARPVGDAAAPGGDRAAAAPGRAWPAEAAGRAAGARGMSRPVCLVIAAMGGEGGGVLTDWIVGAAQRADLPVQGTSIPGVAQRTGATTYYIELWPERHAALGGRQPCSASAPRPATSTSSSRPSWWRPGAAASAASSRPTAPCWSPRSAASSRPARRRRWAMAASTRNA
jgi:pyruvate/2-oxoacid:ferredoxin oxidoreductase beta subunit